MSTSRNGSLLEDLVKLEHLLQADASESYEKLQNRDRKIGIKLEHLKNAPIKQIRSWLGFTDDATFSTEAIGRTNLFISSALIIIGLIMGISTGLALFFYTGEQPINIINVLAIGVGLQLIFLAIFILATLFNSNWLQNILASFNAGRWAARFAYISPSLKNAIDELLNRRNSLADQKIIKWQTVYWSQKFALAFNFALILCCLYLVTFTDLAFGWSTTLAFDNSIVQSITDTLSLPWKTFFPAAVPDSNLIEATRFYRLKTINMGDETNNVIQQAQLAGSWWRFLLLSLLVYGFLPRIITMIISRIQLSKSIKKSILSLPGLHLLLDRMNNPSVATIAETPEVEAAKIQTSDNSKVTALTNRHTYLLHWGQPAFDQALIENWIIQNTAAKPSGFDLIASTNNHSIPLTGKLPKLNDIQTAISIVVKAWEPPTLELTDWLAELRQHYGQEILISLVPYDIDNQNQIKSADLIEIQTWHDFLQRQQLFDIELHGVRS